MCYKVVTAIWSLSGIMIVYRVLKSERMGVVYASPFHYEGAKTKWLCDSRGLYNTAGII